MLYVMSIKLSQILPDDPGNDPHSHAPFFINPGDGKAHIVLLAAESGSRSRSGVQRSRVGQPDVDHAFMYVRDLAGIYLLWIAAFFQVVMVVFWDNALDVSP